MYSKVQARSAFATYLSRVHQRLVNESSASDADESDASNEQMVRTVESIAEKLE
jgi:hypothetical protein